MNDDELARELRAGLERHADRAEVDRAVVDRARSEARRRRTTRWAVLGAAAAVAAVVGVVAVVPRGSDTDDGTGPSVFDAPSSTPTTPTTPTTPATTAPPADVGTRPEYWRGIRVDVPADWGYGNVGSCGELPVDTPYVARPIGVTDACGIPDPDVTPTAPYVWLDADVPVGTDDLGDGWVRETVEVDDVVVSVATQDSEQAGTILDSIAPGDLCDATIAASPDARYGNTVEGAGDFVEGRLCAYQEVEDGEGYELQYARTVDQSEFEDATTAVEAAPGTTPCTGSDPSYEVVVLTAGYADPYGPQDEVALERDIVYDLSCGVVRLGSLGTSGDPRTITEATVPWAGPEFKRLLTGPFSATWAYQRFIGVQG